MPINPDALKNGRSPDLPNFKEPKRPNPNREAYHQQNTDTISHAIALRTEEIGTSLQRLDASLTDFEERYALAAVNRIEQVGLRIEQRMAAILQERAVARTGFNVDRAIEAVNVPAFQLPPAITPMGCLPM